MKKKETIKGTAKLADPVHEIVRTPTEDCPTQGGTFPAYLPEYLEIDGKWQPIPTKHVSQGIPLPLMGRGILDAIGLFGYAQAHALAWQFKAQHEAQGIDVDVRVATFELHFDIKAKRLEDGHVLVS